MGKSSVAAVILTMLLGASVGFSATAANAAKNTFRYCIPVEKVDLSPFRDIRDGKDTAYLMLLKSYISEDPSNPGILDKYEFSPTGDSFTGRINTNLKWSDGSPLTVEEAAFGIAKALYFRPLGERVKVKGTSKINSSGWRNHKYSGIKILDERTFTLEFDSKIENLKGALREAISTNARHNRVWPVKLGDSYNPDKPLVLGKFPFDWDGSKARMKIGSYSVILEDKNSCEKSDISLYPESLKANLNDYSFARSPAPQSILMQVNTEKLSLQQRTELSAWVRKAFTGQPEGSGIISVPSFFITGEAGNKSGFDWGIGQNTNALKGQKIVIGYSIPVFKDLLEEAAKKSHLDISVMPLSTQTVFDAKVQSSAIQEGRHIIFQDLVVTKDEETFLKNAPKTKKSLKDIAIKSASTIPPDNIMLQNLEKNSYEEKSVVPIGRRFLIAYYKKNLPVVPAWTAAGELYFKLANQ